MLERKSHIRIMLSVKPDATRWPSPEKAIDKCFHQIIRVPDTNSVVFGTRDNAPAIIGYKRLHQTSRGCSRNGKQSTSPRSISHTRMVLFSAPEMTRFPPGKKANDRIYKARDFFNG
jgi:hypothetical protein